MQNKSKFLLVLLGIFLVATCARAEGDVIVDEVVVDDIEQIAADAVADYQVEGSLFQQITDLEQEKVLMQLEKERAQLDLELDRLAAEKIKLHMEIDTLSGRAEQQQQEIETEKAKLEAEAARLEREKEKILAAEEETDFETSYSSSEEKVSNTDLTKKYKLVNVIGAGTQLQATITDLATGQTKRVGVGKSLDGYTVKSISLDEGIVFVKDGDTQMLNVGSEK